MLVFSTLPPMFMFWIDRLTVTDELVASRFDPERLDRQAVDRRVVHAEAERDVARARGGDQHHVVGLAADEEVADLRVERPLDGRRGQAYSSTRVVKFVALPPTRTSPICPVPNEPPPEITKVPPGDRSELVVAVLANCEGTRPDVGRCR